MECKRYSGIHKFKLSLISIVLPVRPMPLSIKYTDNALRVNGVHSMAHGFPFPQLIFIPLMVFDKEITPDCFMSMVYSSYFSSPQFFITVRFFLILVSLFYVEVSVTRPVFHIWYCTRGFLFRLKIVLPPS